jgi:hypothetical protein
MDREEKHMERTVMPAHPPALSAILASLRFRMRPKGIAIRGIGGMLVCLLAANFAVAQPLTSSPSTSREVVTLIEDETPVETAERDIARQTLMVSITIFALAIFVGFELITKVPATLHTPLMSGSNAISGITVVGALIAAGASLALPRFSASWPSSWPRSTLPADFWSRTACSRCSRGARAWGLGRAQLLYPSRFVLPPRP